MRIPPSPPEFLICLAQGEGDEEGSAVPAFLEPRAQTAATIRETLPRCLPWHSFPDRGDPRELKHITIAGQAQTERQSPSEILLSEAAEPLFQPKEGRLQKSITQLRNDDGAGYRDRKLEQRVVRLSAFRLSKASMWLAGRQTAAH
jgi:hypothetical protein